MSYYHYTKGCHLPTIVKEGIIRTTNAGCEKREKPAAWLTKSPEWESACNIGKISNYEEFEVGKVYSSEEVDWITVNNDFMKKEIGMCRIVISETLPTISWAKFKYVSNISEAGYNGFDHYCRGKGFPVDKWLCTFNPIPKKYWESVEMLVGNEWVKWDGNFSIEEYVELCLSCNGKNHVKKTA